MVYHGQTFIQLAQIHFQVQIHVLNGHKTKVEPTFIRFLFDEVCYKEAKCDFTIPRLGSSSFVVNWGAYISGRGTNQNFKVPCNRRN